MLPKKAKEPPWVFKMSQCMRSHKVPVAFTWVLLSLFLFWDIQIPGSRFLMQTPEKKNHVFLAIFFQIVSFLSCPCEKKKKKRIKLYLFHFQIFPVSARTTNQNKVESIDLQGFHTPFLWSFACSFYMIKKSNTDSNLTRSLVSALLG